MKCAVEVGQRLRLLPRVDYRGDPGWVEECMDDMVGTIRIVKYTVENHEGDEDDWTPDETHIKIECSDYWFDIRWFEIIPDKVEIEYV